MVKKEKEIKVVEPIAPTGAVCYADGSSSPNPGYTGSGIHGYLYTTELGKKGTGLKTHLITNKGYVPKGVELSERNIVQPTKYFNGFSSSLEIGTNNYAEINAIYDTLIYLDKYNLKNIHILSDSEYARRGFTEWLPIWKSKNWVKSDGAPVQNATMWKKLLITLEEQKNKGTVFTTEWVKGHNEIFGNIQADNLASLASNYSINKIAQNSVETSDADGYWKKKVYKHPFFIYQSIFFNSEPNYNKVGIYYINDKFDPKAIIGNRNNTACVGIVILANPDRCIETIKDKHFKIANGAESLINIRTDKLFDQEVYESILNHGEIALLNRKRMDLDWLDKEPISTEEYPPGKSFVAVNNINMIEKILFRFLHVKVNKEKTLSFPFPISIEETTDEIIHNTSFGIQDITLKFFNEEGIKKDLLNNESLNFEVPFTLNDTISKNYNLKVLLKLGMDLPTRSNLKSLEDPSTKIWLILWRESINSVRYCIISTCSNAIGIWSNIYPNLILLKD